MLVLSRKSQQSVVVGSSGGLERLLTVTVLEITDSRVKLGFEADADIPVHRLELWERICEKGKAIGGEANAGASVVASD